jgi:hypothetical protein
MKRILLTLLLMLTLTSGFGQDWQVISQKGDALKGTQDYISYVYYNEDAGLVYWSVYDNYFEITCLKHRFFNYDSRRGYRGNNIVIGLVGFYDESDNLIDKIEDFCFENKGSDGRSDVIYPNKYTTKGGNNRKNAKKILDYIGTNKGYVRFILPIYGGSDLDFKVKCR